jgi:hypothetical protein
LVIPGSFVIPGFPDFDHRASQSGDPKSIMSGYAGSKFSGGGDGLGFEDTPA